MKHRLTVRAWLALTVTLLLWSSSYAGIRAALRAYTPGQLAVLRFAVASVVLAIYARLDHFRTPELRDSVGLILSGAVGITFYMLALSYGEVTVTAGAASLIISSTPIWTALVAATILKERLGRWGWACVLMSFFGVALIASGEAGGVQFSPRALVIVLAAVASAIYIVVGKRFLLRYSALEFTAYTIWPGTLLMLPFGRGLLHTARIAPLATTLVIVYLGIFPGALAYVAYAYVLSHGTAGSTASFLYLTPVLAIFIAWVWMRELPSMLSFIGGAAALAGVLMLNLLGKPRGLTRESIRTPS